uniref:Uncharacterized protein n=1 Tax=Arundo donax TaxID=35708 RepID=A0A0A9BIE4_ARUDO
MGWPEACYYRHGLSTARPDANRARAGTTRSIGPCLGRHLGTVSRHSMARSDMGCHGTI